MLAIGDDPGAYSSQNEQDSRIYARFAKIPCLEPSNSQEAKDYTKRAFDLSRKISSSVMLRGLTRVMHSSSLVTIEEPRPENPVRIEKNPDQMLAIPKNIVRLHKALNKKQEELKDWVEASGLNVVIRPGRKKGIIACGFANVYAGEYGADCSVLKISAYPFHERMIKDFVANLEEVWSWRKANRLSKRLRASIRHMSKANSPEKFPVKVSLDLMCWPRTSALPRRRPPKQRKRYRTSAGPLPRMPAPRILQGIESCCPAFTTGDIGCYTLGAAPPLNAIDTCLCMGASIGKAAAWLMPASSVLLQ